MSRVIWGERATADLTTILRYYDDIDFELGQSLFLRIVAAAGPLVEQPEIGSLVGHRGTRKWRVKHAPFLLFYRVLTDRRVEILRVRHVAEDWRPA